MRRKEFAANYIREVTQPTTYLEHVEPLFLDKIFSKAKNFLDKIF